jgi:biopolymer transport protein ExbB
MIVNLNVLGLMFLQGEVGFDIVSMWNQMGWLARAVVIILGVMSAWSIGVMIDRALSFSSARKQSREFAPAVAGCLKEGKVEEAISVAEQNKRSHLAKVVEAGLQEFRAHGMSNELAGEQIESSRRACERSSMQS